MFAEHARGIRAKLWYRCIIVAPGAGSVEFSLLELRDRKCPADQVNALA